MDRDDTIVAVVPTYRPTAALRDLLAVVRPQVSHLVVSDDASPCTSDHLLRQASDHFGATVIRHDRNAGIARGLNEGLAAAINHGATWLITFDQDTVVSPDYVPALVAEAQRRIDAGIRLGALGAEFINDGAATLSYPADTEVAYPQTEELIQTGTLWHVSALRDAGGFNEELGIDAVDAAACLALRQGGYQIGIAPGLAIDHAIGNSTSVSIGGRSIMVTRHSPERRTSMLRNRIRLFPGEFRQSPRHAFRTVRRVLVNQGAGLVLEQNRWVNLKASARALSRRRTR